MDWAKLLNGFGKGNLSICVTAGSLLLPTKLGTAKQGKEEDGKKVYELIYIFLRYAPASFARLWVDPSSSESEHQHQHVIGILFSRGREKAAHLQGFHDE